MTALAVTILLFAFWSMIGYAVAHALNSRSDALFNLLLAPVVGAVITLLPTFWLNRLGIPVGRFAPILLIVLLLLALVLLWRRRPLLPLKKYLPFVVVLIIALLPIVQPLLHFGFQWRSYGNDDMANYMLRAARLHNHGYFDVPTIEELRRDYSQIFWFMDVPEGNRTGADLLLAWTLGIAGPLLHVDALQLFMPVILAFHLMLISASGALIYSFRRYYLAALFGCALVGVSSLTILGTLYQLFAQVPGVALLAGCAALLLRPLRSVLIRPKVALQYGVLLAVMVAALLLTYPEITPFLALAFLLYVALGLLRKWWTLGWRVHLISFAPALLLMALFLNTYLFDYARFLLTQTIKGSGNGTNSIFPYFLQPTGLAALWGFQPINAIPAEPLLTLLILAGTLLLLLAGVLTLALLWRGHPTAAVTAAMMAFGSILFITQSGFGLFKLAMFIQPFLIGVIVVACLVCFKKFPLWLRFIPLILLGLAGIPAIHTYTNASWGLTPEFNSFNNISGMSLNVDLQTILTEKKPTLVVADTVHQVAGKFEALETIGVPTSFVSQPFFWTLLPPDRDFMRAPCLPENSYVQYFAECRLLYNDIYDDLRTYNFRHLDPADPDRVSLFFGFLPDELAQQAMAQTEGSYWLFSTPQLTVLNRSRLQDYLADAVVLLPDSDASDMLIFMFAMTTGEARSFNNALGAMTTDYFYRDQRMQGIRRFLLLRVVNPSDAPRLVLNLTSTLRGDGSNQLPPAVIVGDQRYPLPLIGRGSARIFSPPLQPQTINGFDYLLLDMGEDNTNELLPPFQSGIMGLFGRNIQRMSGMRLAFARNISLISTPDLEALTPPAAVSAFPQDLDNQALEYAGVYEDGWVSEQSFFGLNKSTSAEGAGTGDLVLRGVVPQIDDPNFTTTLRVLVDGEEVAVTSLAIGEFEVRVDSEIAAGRHRIELQFSDWQVLPGADGRPIAALLRLVGFE